MKIKVKNWKITDLFLVCEEKFHISNPKICTTHKVKGPKDVYLCNLLNIYYIFGIFSVWINDLCTSCHLI